MEDPSPYDPQYSNSDSATLPGGGDWIRCEPPFEPPFGKWVKAPPPNSAWTVLLGLPPLPPEFPPLLMLPAMSESQLASMTSVARPDPPRRPRSEYNCTSNEPFDTIYLFGSREKRRLLAATFKTYRFHWLQNTKSMKVRKYCVRKSAIYDSPTTDKSVGITWVGVHGINSICAVIRKKDFEHLKHQVIRHEGHVQTEEFLKSFWNVIVSEVEYAEGPSGESSQTSNESQMKPPFGVVCVVSDNDEGEKSRGSKASRAEIDADKAINFLNDEMRSHSTFRSDKTVKTAISAIMHLFHQHFDADEIRVFAWKKDDAIIGKELWLEQKQRHIEEISASSRLRERKRRSRD